MSLMMYIRIGILGALIALSASTWYLWGANKDKAAQIDSMEVRIQGLKEAIVLNERLAEQNRQLDRDEFSVREEIRNADGYNIPLPTDIQRAIDRLRTE